MKKNDDSGNNIWYEEESLRYRCWKRIVKITVKTKIENFMTKPVSNQKNFNFQILLNILTKAFRCRKASRGNKIKNIYFYETYEF